MARFQSKKKQDTGPDKLYRVYRVKDGRMAYLPSHRSKGLTLEEAERLSNSLQVETEVRLEWERPEE